MNKIFFIFLLLIYIFNTYIVQTSRLNTCQLPKKCVIYRVAINMFEIGQKQTAYGISCHSDVIDELNFTQSINFYNNSKCKLDERNLKLFSFRSMSNQKPFRMFSKPSLFKYASKFGVEFSFQIVLIRHSGFIIEQFEQHDKSNSDVPTPTLPFRQINEIVLYHSNIKLYLNRNRPVLACQELIRENLTLPRGIFQPPKQLAYGKFTLDTCKFAKNLCPLMFASSQIGQLVIKYMKDTLLVTNILRFSHLDSRLE